MKPLLSLLPFLFCFVNEALLSNAQSHDFSLQYAVESRCYSAPSLVGTWKVYIVQSNHKLTFSHFEEYKNNNEYLQWSYGFLVKGHWRFEKNNLCIQFDRDAKAICGKVEFKGNDSFYYLEDGTQLKSLLYSVRQGEAPANPSGSGGNKEEYTEKKPCILCTGIGDKLCLSCFGSGKKTRDEVSFGYDKTIYKTVEYPCQLCEGKGRITCSVCNGLGYTAEKKIGKKQN